MTSRRRKHEPCRNDASNKAAAEFELSRSTGTQGGSAAGVTRHRCADETADSVRSSADVLSPSPGCAQRHPPRLNDRYALHDCYALRRVRGHRRKVSQGLTRSYGPKPFRAVLFGGERADRFQPSRRAGRIWDQTMKLLHRRRMLHPLRIVLTMMFAIGLTAPTRSDAAEIKILTTRAMNHVLTELAAVFQRTSDHTITIRLAPPNEIRKRIVDGETVDAVMSGGGTVDSLVQQGKIAPGDKLILARVGIGVAGRAGAAEAGHRFGRCVPAHAARRQVDRLYRPGGRRHERHPFREGARSLRHRQGDQSQGHPERPRRDHAQRRDRRARRCRARHPVDQRDRAGPRRRAARSAAGRPAGDERDLGGN